MKEQTAPNSILAAHTDAVLSAPPTGWNGVEFDQMTLAQAKRAAADMAMVVEIYRRSWRELSAGFCAGMQHGAIRVVEKS